LFIWDDRFMLILVTSMVIEHLRRVSWDEGRKCIAYRFCDDAIPGSDTRHTMLRSLIRQLLPPDLPISDFVRVAVTKHRSSGSEPTVDEFHILSW
jgi:hypothetical protein